MTYQERLQALLARLRVGGEVPHRLGDGCECLRCEAHRMVLQVELAKHTENEEYRAHVESVQRRARRKARLTVMQGAA